MIIFWKTITSTQKKRKYNSNSKTYKREDNVSAKGNEGTEVQQQLKCGNSYDETNNIDLSTSNSGISLIETYDCCLDNQLLITIFFFK
jgi:hypothetical protein